MINKIKHSVRSFSICLSALAISALPVFAGSSIHHPWPQDGSDLPADAAVEWGRLDNGVRYVILPWEEPPERVSLRLVVEAGSLHEKENQRGLAHFLEHMAFNGTENFSAGEMVGYFQRLGMSFGADTNAHTWWKETVYKLELPNNSPDLLEDSFLLLRDYADRMLLGEEELDSERGIILSEKRDRKSPQSEMSEARLKFNLPQSLIPERLPIGIESVLRHADRDTFVDFYESWYTADRMVIVAVGAVDSETLVPFIERHFESMAKPAERRPDPDLGQVTDRGGLAARFYDDPNLATTDVHLYTIRAIEPGIDNLEKRIGDLALSLANQIINRRFEVMLRQDDVPFTRAGAYAYDWLEFAAFSGFYASGQPDQWEEALEVISKELRRALDFGFTQAELEEARARARNAFEEAAQQAPTRRSRALADALGRSIIDNEVFMDPAVRKELLVPALMQFTVEDLHQALLAAWDSEDRIVFVSGDLSQRIKSVFNDSLEAEVLPPDESELEAFAYVDFGRKGELVEDNFIEDLLVTHWKFENGARVSMMPTPYESNTIRVLFRFGGGLLELDPEFPALKLLAESIFIEGGLGAHDKETLDRLMAGRTVSTGFMVDDDAFVLSGSTNARDLEFQLQLLTAYLTDPGFRPEAERRTRRDLSALYNQLRMNPQAVLQNELPRFIHGDDPRFGYPPREEWDRVSTDEVADWLAEPLHRGYLEVAIVGDLPDTEEILPLLAKTVGALPARTEEAPQWADARLIDFPVGVERKVLTFQADLPQAFTIVHWPTIDASDNDRVRRLSVLGSIFSDRLRVQVREEMGEAYSPYAFNNSSHTFSNFGFIRAFVGADPGQADALADKVVEIAAALAREGPDEDELVRAVEPQRTAIRQQRRDNRYWLNRVVADSQRRPQQLEWARTLETYLDHVTLEEMEVLAREFLQPEGAVKVLVLPAGN